LNTIRLSVADRCWRVGASQRLRKDANGKRDGFDYLAVMKREVRVPLANGTPWRPKIVSVETLRRV
jgi:hypothetical protein